MVSERFVQLAIREAKKSLSKFKHGSVSFKGNTLLHKGYNRPNNFMKEIGRRNHQHAELRSIKNLSERDALDSELIVIRLTKTGKFANSHPCLKCIKMLRAKGVRKVWYSDNTGDIIPLWLRNPCKER